MPIVAGCFDVILHASLLGLGCLVVGWLRGAIDLRPPLPRLLIWSAAFGAMALVLMLSPTTPIPGQRIDVRAAALALGAVFGGPGAVAILTALEVAVRQWLGGPYANVGSVGILLSCIPAFAVAFALQRKPRDPSLRMLLILGLLCGIAGPAASIIEDPATALRLLSPVATSQMAAVALAVPFFAAIITRADRARRSNQALREREEHLTEANRQLTDLTVKLERRNQDYAEAQRHAEELLVQLNAIFENAPFGIFIKETDGRVRVANRAFAKLIGQPVEVLTGRLTSDFMTPEDGAMARASDAEVVRSGLPVAHEEQPQTPGAPGWLWAIKFPLKDSDGTVTGIGGFDIDVTPLKQQAIALERSALQLKKMHEIARIIYWYQELLPDGTRRILAGEPRDFQAMTGWPATESLERENYLAKCVHPDDRDRVREVHAAFARGEIDTYVCEYNINKPDGSVLPVKVWSQRVREPGNDRDFILGAMQDVSEQHDRERRLAEAMSRAEMSERAKSEFLANLSHELRTPLNAVIGYSELLQLRLGPADVTGNRQYVDAIGQGGRRLNRIVSQLLEIAGLDFGTRALNETEIDVDQAMRDGVALVQERFAEKSIDFDTAGIVSAAAIRAEHGYFTQALMHVLTNAAQHSDNGGRVTVSATIGSGGDLELRVADSGPGIAEDLLPRLGSAFVHAERAHTRTGDGVGLGLAMCQRIMALHGGRLEIESAPGKGTCVTLTYPASRLSASATRGVPLVANAGH